VKGLWCCVIVKMCQMFTFCFLLGGGGSGLSIPSISASKLALTALIIKPKAHVLLIRCSVTATRPLVRRREIWCGDETSGLARRPLCGDETFGAATRPLVRRRAFLSCSAKSPLVLLGDGLSCAATSSQMCCSFLVRRCAF